MSAMHFKPAQHGAWFAPQLVPAVAEHAQDVATKSPWLRCAGTAFSLTVMRCAFAALPGGVWQMVVFVAAATLRLATRRMRIRRVARRSVADGRVRSSSDLGDE